MFNGTGEGQTADTHDFAPFVARLKGEIMNFSGVAFPVRLGSMGNGYTVFMASYLDLDSEVLIELHQRSHQLMKDFMAHLLKNLEMLPMKLIVNQLLKNK